MMSHEFLLQLEMVISSAGLSMRNYTQLQLDTLQLCFVALQMGSEIEAFNTVEL